MSEGEKDVPTEIVLRSGYAVEAPDGPGGDMLQLRAPDGRLCLKITLTAAGPEVHLSGVALSLTTQGDVNIDCDRFHVQARGEVAIEAGGDLRARAEGRLETEAFAQRHRARRGDLALIANDDVTVDGERIRLNSPRMLPRIEAALPAAPPGEREGQGG